jgi:hypothetical protein
MKIVLRHLAFTGPNSALARVGFVDGLNLVYGASNTGKSFAVKAIDYLLGGSRQLPEIDERRPYDRAWLGLSIPPDEVTLSRALASGNFMLDQGLVTTAASSAERRVLGARHDAGGDGNVSQFMLSHLGLQGLRIAVDANGKKNSLSFRDVVRFCIVDETTIQSEHSPVESGVPTSRTKERSTFKLLLTGIDDGAIVEVSDGRTFKSANAAQLEMLDDMINAVETEVGNEFPDVEGLYDQAARLDASFAAAQADLDAAQASIGDLLVEKRELSRQLSMAASRLDDLDLSLARFDQLDAVYRSDIERLEALDEAGFLIALGGGRDCPLCGAEPGAQRHQDEIGDVERIRAAAEAETLKIARQREDLRTTVHQVEVERERLDELLPDLATELAGVEEELGFRTPSATLARRAVQEIMEVRDHVRRGLSLLDQLKSLRERRDEVAARRPASKGDRPRIGVDGPTAHEFAQMVSGVLKAWRFPGQCHVSFDEATYDLRIDGKLRSHNGKGVRAITHAAFKVALLLFCRQRGLPHPGFLVLDSPLLTYRDPIPGETKAAEDAAIASSSLKEHFFAHLASVSGEGQFIVVENVDPPTGLNARTNIEIFSGLRGSGRPGLL